MGREEMQQSWKFRCYKFRCSDLCRLAFPQCLNWYHVSTYMLFLLVRMGLEPALIWGPCSRHCWRDDVLEVTVAMESEGTCLSLHYAIRFTKQWLCLPVRDRLSRCGPAYVVTRASLTLQGNASARIIGVSCAPHSNSVLHFKLQLTASNAFPRIQYRCAHVCEYQKLKKDAVLITISSDGLYSNSLFSSVISRQGQLISCTQNL